MRTWHKQGDSRVSQVAAKEMMTRGSKGRFRLETSHVKAAKASSRQKKGALPRTDIVQNPNLVVGRTALSRLAVSKVDPFKILPICVQTPDEEIIFQMC